MSNTEASIADHETERDTRRAEADGVLSDFASGFHPATTRVALRPNLHLLADLQRLAAQAESSTDSGELKRLEAEFDTLKEQFLAERVLTLRAISADVVRAVQRQARRDGLDVSALQTRLDLLAKADKPDPDAIEELEDEAAEVGLRITCRLLEAAIVDEDVDEEWLVSLARSSEIEFERLNQAAGELQKNPERVAPDFLPARSATRSAG